MARGTGMAGRRTRRKPSLVAVTTSLIMFIWWKVPATNFLFVSAFFLVVAVLLEIMLLVNPAAAAVLPQVTAVTVVLGLLTAYGAWAHQDEKGKAR